MLMSTSYHTFRDENDIARSKWLKLDLIGIVIMIFMMAICGNWLGFTRYPLDRLYIIFVVCIVFTSNFILSLLPCYADEKYEMHRIMINIATILLTFTLALSWYFFFANDEEVQLFFGPLMLSFFWAFVGFLFFHFKFPECVFTEEKYGFKVAYYCQIYC